MPNLYVSQKDLAAQEDYHKGPINCLMRLNQFQYITGSDDQTMKIWSRTDKRCNYTFKMNKPVECMALAGSLGNVLVVAQGTGDL